MNSKLKVNKLAILDMTLSEAVLSDIDGIMELEKKGFDQSVREDRVVFEERIDCFSEGFLVLKDAAQKNKIIGCICSEIWTYHEPILSDNFSLGHSIKDYHRVSEGELYISSLVIDPNYHGQGLGKRLFEELIQRIQQTYPHIFSTVLMVNETWIKAQKLYESMGFKPILVVNDFFNSSDGGNQNGIVMRKLK